MTDERRIMEASVSRREQISLPVSPEMRLFIERMAALDGRTTSNWLRHLISKEMGRSKLTACKQCSETFLVGRGGKREGAIFCSERCKIKHHLKLKKQV